MGTFSTRLMTRMHAATAVFVVTMLLSGCATLSDQRAEKLSVDQDILRLKHLRQIATLVESYRDEVGHYPLAGAGRGGFSIIVYIDPLDLSTAYHQGNTGEGVVLHPALLEATLAQGLKRPVSLPHNPDSRAGRDAYLYRTADDDYFLTVYTDHPLPFAKPLNDGRHGVSITSRQKTESSWLYDSLTHYDPFILASNATPYNAKRLDRWIRKPPPPLPQPSAADRLNYAIVTADLTALQSAIADGAPLNPVCAEGIPCQPLNLAARIGAPWLVQKLLTAGADPNGTDGHGDTALLQANNQTDPKAGKNIIRQLLEAGANPNLPNRWGWTPFAALASRGYVTLMEMALTKGADVNLSAPAPGIATIQHGDPPLVAAIRARQVKAVRWLLAHGADPARLGYDGMDAKQVARTVRQPVITRMLTSPPSP